MSERSTKIIINLVKVLLLGVVIWYITVEVDYKKLLLYMRTMDFLWLFLAIGAFLAGMLFNINKWRFILSRYIPVSFRQAALSMMGGYTLSLLTPARLGEVGRCFFISSLERRKTVSLVGIDKMFNVSITTFLGVFFLQFMPIPYPLTVKVIVYFFSLLILTFIVLYTRYPSLLHRLLSRVSFLRKGKGEEFLVAVKNSNKKDNIIIFLMTLAMYLFYLAEFVFFSMALAPGSFIVALNGYVISLFLKTALPLTVADWGIKEVSLMEFYMFFGLSSEIALGAALFIYFLNILLPAALGLIPVLKLKKGDLLYGKE
ncbi:flippase-like domain-containing protein [Candidatus Mcinerneyibacteriota bacterium]|nr:flippase-like domain-containing protein [Candidatus Mcinerneyibacteriota bacterium]